jgi:phosphoglucomutase
VSADAAGARPIRFGTSGWRGLLGEEVTAPRVRALAAAIGAWACEARRAARILIGHDTRFLGSALVEEMVPALEAAGARVLRAASPVPTPVLAHAARNGRADLAVVVTASHNRPADETRAAAALARGVPRTIATASGARSDCVAPYLDALRERIALPSRVRATLFYDALHGTGAGVCDRALASLGARVVMLRAEHAPRFGGRAPDPSPANLGALAVAVRAARGVRLGLATDGDADRFAVLDAAGRPLSETDALALLVDHLARTGRVQRGVAISIATGTLVEHVAREHGLAVERHPIGFKYLSQALVRGAADVAGEESGGFAWDPVARDKDGILACLLFAEMVTGYGVEPRARLRALARRHGRRLCGRQALSATPAARARLAAIAAAPPERVGADRVREVDGRDGVRLAFDDGFLMLRASGTEAVLRVYAEASDARGLADRFAAGAGLLGIAWTPEGTPGTLPK